MLENVRRKTVDLISVYDELLEKKSEELAVLESDKTAGLAKADNNRLDKSTELDAPVINAGLVGLAPPPKYRDSAVADLYGTIRESFSFNTEDVNSALKNISQRRSDGKAHYEQMLDYETAFRLSSLPSEEQREILEECLSGLESEFLQEYLACERPFSALEFFDLLQEKAQMHDGRVVVRVPEHMASFTLLNDCDAVIEYDEGICEGFIIEKDGRLYDYSVKSRELV